MTLAEFESLLDAFGAKVFYNIDDQVDARQRVLDAYAAKCAEADELREALRDLIDAFRNPGDDGVFEDGEVPALDLARAALSAPRTEATGGGDA